MKSRSSLPFERVLGAIALAAVFMIPLVFDFRGYDVFRLPKLLLLQGAGVILIGSAAAAVLLGHLSLAQIIPRKRIDILLAAIIGWTVISAVFSSHRTISAYALLTAIAAAALFLATRSAARGWTPVVLIAVLVPAVINAVLAMLQELRIWNLVPVNPEVPHASTIGLLGNPNDVGSYLAPAFAVALGWTFAASRWSARLALGATTLLLGAGVVASRTRAALLAMFVCAIAATVLKWRWRAVLPMVALLLVGLLVVLAYPPLLARLEPPGNRAELATFMSGRIVAFAAAAEMIRNAPVFGVGPGCFVVEYMDAAIRAYPDVSDFAVAGRQFMFGEAHNDHLQIAAETGIPGYLLFLLAMGSIAALSFRQPAEDQETNRVVRFTALPLVASGATLMLLQFPLYLAAPLATYVFAAGLVAGWADA